MLFQHPSYPAIFFQFFLVHRPYSCRFPFLILLFLSILLYFSTCKLIVKKNAPSCALLHLLCRCYFVTYLSSSTRNFINSVAASNLFVLFGIVIIADSTG